ncbi:MAG: hypothetical protein ABI599_14540 [Flavobacteriales bacterium]
MDWVFGVMPVVGLILLFVVLVLQKRAMRLLCILLSASFLILPLMIDSFRAERLKFDAGLFFVLVLLMVLLGSLSWKWAR